jgi:DNA-binding NarL/FixJ family response regulator
MKEIFYLENDENDFVLLQVALRKAGLPDAVRWFRRSSELRTHILCLAPDQVPKVILIDLLLDGEYGIEMVEWLNEQAHLRHIPTFVFSSGRVLQEIVSTLQTNATGYMFKPSKFDAWRELALQLRDIIQSPVAPAARVGSAGDAIRL